MIDSFNRYLLQGIPFGGFMSAVMCNQLFEAFGRADWRNKERMGEICGYIQNYFPATSYGSVETYAYYLDNIRSSRRNNN